MSELKIPVRVEKEEDLYSPFDPLAFSGDFTDYLSETLDARKPMESVSLEIQSMGKMDRVRFEQAYSVFIEKLREQNHREMAKSRINALRLLGIGVAFIVLGIVFAARMNEVVAAIVSTIGSFSVWEAAAVWIETLPALRHRERLLAVMARAEITFTEGAQP